jgi:chemotaxis protein methyltransferase CheR
LLFARRKGLSGIGELVAKLRAPGAERLAACVTEAMLITDTRFFRDGAPFDAFVATMLPTLMQARGASRRIRVWCAGCAMGQEPYSLAMVIAEAAGLFDDWSFEILATDLSPKAIERARLGMFSHFEVQRGLSIQRHLAWFAREGADWRIDPRLRGQVSFRVHNLLDDFAPLGVFDVVFCRNVLRLMDEETRADVALKLNQAVADDGYVVLGAQEASDLVARDEAPLRRARAS